MTLFQAFGQFAGQAAAALPEAMVLMTPTSVSVTGGSASIVGNGQVTFSAISVLNVDGVFTSEFRNYIISYQGTITSSNVCMRMRVGGVQNSTNYLSQYLVVSGSTLSRNLEGASATRTFIGGSSNPAGATIHVYRPNIAAITNFRTIGSSQAGGISMEERMNHHDVATAYDGFNMLPLSTGTLSGKLQVYGVRC